MSALTEILPWQFGTWEKLAWQLGEGRLPHALFLVGSPGVGKARFARALAQRLLCLSPKDDAACGHCRGCELNLAGHHPDFLLVEPEQAGKVIKVDQVREVVEFSAKTSQQGGARVVVLDPADALNANAANALLKCLEEPGRDAFFLLVSSRPSAVLPTIRSRCQRVLFHDPTHSQALQWLGGALGDQALAEALLASGAQPLQALAWEHDKQFELRDRALRVLREVAGRSLNPLAAAAQLAEYPVSDALYWLLAALRDDLKQSVQPGAALLAPAEVLFSAYEAVVEAARMARSGANPNAQLLLEQLLMRWAELTRPARKAPGRELV